MENKRKLLEALDCTLDDVSEDRLIDLVIDAYTAAKERNLQLVRENADERERLYHERENLNRELHKMRSDAFYSAGGDYYFCDGKRKFCARIQGSQIAMFERSGDIDVAIQQVPSNEWHSLSYGTKK